MRFMVAIAVAVTGLAVASGAVAGDREDCYSNNHAVAISACTRLIQLDRKNSTLYFNRGLSYAANGNSDLAIADYNKSLELDPKNASAYYARGNRHRERGDSDRAIADYTRAIEIDAKYVNAYVGRGNARADKNDRTSAIADYTKAIELNPKDADNYYNRGLSYNASGKQDLAIADYTKAIELDPRHSNAYYARANRYRDKGDNDRAIADYTKSIELNPKASDAVYSRGGSRSNKGDLEGAVADYSRAIELDPKDGDAYYARAITYTTMGRYQAARADYDSVLRLPDKTTSIGALHGRTLAQLAKLPPPPVAPPVTSLTLTSPTTTSALRRVALVIGNGSYKHLSVLGNPVMDAKAIAALLTRHGFKVILKGDLDFAGFEDAFAELRTAASNADEIFIFYAGHGLNPDGEDLLAPVDFDYTCPEDRPGAKVSYRRGVALSKLTDRIGTPEARKLIIIDACRNAPFARCKSRSADSDDGIGLQFRGLGRPAVGAEEPLIVSSTKPGGRAIDGRPGENSPFLKALLKRFGDHPGLKFNTLLALTANDVDKATNGLQRPQVVSSGGSRAPEMCLRGTECTWQP